MALFDRSPTFLVNLPAYGGLLSVPLTGPRADVVGYTAPEPPPDKAVVDRTAAKFQAFYDGLPPEEQAVLAMLLHQTY
jgi:hypothetical protein